MKTSPIDLSPLRRSADALEVALEVLAAHKGATKEHMLLRDGVIQRFEFCFELAWKTLRRYLQEFGLDRVDHLTNRELFRLGQEQGVLRDAEAWIIFLRHRNLTSHVYNESIAALVFSSAAPFLAEARHLIGAIEERIA
jgi:nucleotidyltransferase substrate binding protein (TIGR01987 family)